MAGEFQVSGKNANAPFTLKVHRGDGMALLAMNWKTAQPPDDFVGFAIEIKNPGDDRFRALKNRIGFPDQNGKAIPGKKSSRESPFQMFRWVNFPFNAEVDGEFSYRVTPVFMNPNNDLSFGEAQEASLELRRETYPGQLNVCFTRGFISSQAFLDNFGGDAVDTLLPKKADDGLHFVPTHPKTKEALEWMGFESRREIYRLLDEAVADPIAKVIVNAYDLSEAGFVERLEKLGNRLRIIVDDSNPHGKAHSGETQAADRLRVSAGAANVKRHHMRTLEHNKFIVVTGNVKRAVGGSTNFSWRGFYVQSNNAVFVTGTKAIQPFIDAFEDYWKIESGDPDYNDRIKDFTNSASAVWQDLGLANIDAKVAFSPHSSANALLNEIAADIGDKTKSSLFYSLAFLYQTPGVIQDAIEKVTNTDGIFVYGMSDKKTGGIELTKPGNNPTPVFPSVLGKKLPSPFKEEVTGGNGIRLHHKFVVIDFDKPTARVYLGSYNFSSAADIKNGENLWLIRDRRVAVSYMVEALRLFDHYSFRVASMQAKKDKTDIVLKRPPRKPGDEPWWKKNYTEPQRIRDREIFS